MTATAVPAAAAATIAATTAGADVGLRARIILLLGAAALAVPGPSPAAPGATVELRVSRAGFSPAQLSLHKGEAVHLVLTASDGEHCFAVDELRIEKRVVPGRPTRFDLVPDRAGTFTYYCCLESGEAAARERGQLTVTE